MKLIATVTIDYRAVLSLESILIRAMLENERTIAKGASPFDEMAMRENEKLQRVRDAIDVATVTNNMKLVEA